LVNGDFASSNFSFEDKEKIKIKPLKMVLNVEKDFEKIRDYFTDQQNSLISLNHALVNDGIFLEIKDNYSFNKPLIIYNFFTYCFYFFFKPFVIFFYKLLYRQSIKKFIS